MNAGPSNLNVPTARPPAAAARAARILRAGYICDIIRDQLTHPSIFHWVVQHCETDEIVGLGQARSFAEAEMTSIWFLNDLRLRRAI